MSAIQKTSSVPNPSGQTAEREGFLTIAIGHMGVGKSFTTQKMLDPYRKFTGRKILIFDPNNEDTYANIKSIYFDVIEVEAAKKKQLKEGGVYITQSEKNITKIPNGEIRRILPFTKYGQKMSREQMAITMIAICENFWNGLILLEDINRYISNFESTEISSLFKTIRHQSQDVIMHMQSINPLRRIHYEACQVIRMHNDSFDIDRAKSKVGEQYEILKIAQNIVRNEYKAGNKRFFCHVHLLQKHIENVTFDQFVFACNQYLTSQKQVLRDIASEVANQNGRINPNHSDLVMAKKLWIWEHVDYLPEDKRPKIVPKNQTKIAA